MKKVFFLVLAIAVLTIAMNGCGGSRANITMTTENEKVSFRLVGTDNVTIDWGDGNVANLTLQEMGNWYPHDYSFASSRKIKISGENITELYCQGMGLTSLNVSKNSALTKLYCSNNRLTSLDVSKNTVLAVLVCSNNRLTSLDASKNLTLTDLECLNNEQLIATGLDALFSTLHGNTIEGKVKNIYASGNSGISWARVEDRLPFPNCNPNIAESKGWRVW